MRNLINTVFTEWGNVGDGFSGSLLLGSLLDVLPSIAAILSIIWFSIRIYESETVQRLLMGRNIEKRSDDN